MSAFLIGEQGIQGEQGPQGSQGDQGTQGDQGPTGNTGATGSSIGSFGLYTDGGGSVITTGSKALVISPYIATITDWYMTSGITGSAVVDIKRNGISIIGSGNKPTLSTQNYATAVVNSWTSTSVSIGDVLEFNIDSVSTITNLNVVIKINK